MARCQHPFHPVSCCVASSSCAGRSTCRRDMTPCFCCRSVCVVRTGVCAFKRIMREPCIDNHEKGLHPGACEERSAGKRGATRHCPPGRARLHPFLTTTLHRVCTQQSSRQQECEAAERHSVPQHLNAQGCANTRGHSKHSSAIAKRPGRPCCCSPSGRLTERCVPHVGRACRPGMHTSVLSVHAC